MLGLAPRTYDIGTPHKVIFILGHVLLHPELSILGHRIEYLRRPSMKVCRQTAYINSSDTSLYSLLTQFRPHEDVYRHARPYTDRNTSAATRGAACMGRLSGLGAPSPPKARPLPSRAEDALSFLAGQRPTPPSRVEVPIPSPCGSKARPSLPGPKARTRLFPAGPSLPFSAGLGAEGPLQLPLPRGSPSRGSKSRPSPPSPEPRARPFPAGRMLPFPAGLGREGPLPLPMRAEGSPLPRFPFTKGRGPAPFIPRALPPGLPFTRGPKARPFLRGSHFPCGPKARLLPAGFPEGRIPAPPFAAEGLPLTPSPRTEGPALPFPMGQGQPPPAPPLRADDPLPFSVGRRPAPPRGPKACPLGAALGA